MSTQAGLPVAASAEYEAARAHAILVDRTERVQLRAHGRDPVRMIQGLITNDLAGAPQARAVYAAMLTPKGRMIAELRAIRLSDGSVLLDLDAAALEGALAHLRRMVPPLFARLDAPQPPLRVLGVYGPEAGAIVRTVGIDFGAEPGEDRVERADPDLIAVSTGETGLPGIDLFVPAARADEVRRALAGAGATPAGADTLELLRIEAGRPRWGSELDPERIPLEAKLLERAISTSKGCYTGQEVIIRILHRGHVNWQLRGLLLGESEPPSRGTELSAEAGGKVVARVTSAVRSPALGQTIALAYVRRELEPGAPLRMPDGTVATVAALPFDTGKAT